MDTNDALQIIGALLSLWLLGFGAGKTFRMFKQVIERASRP
jgi:hypothetical protein